MSLQQAPTSGESSKGEESADLAAGGATLTPTELAAVGYEGGFTNPTALAEWIGIVNDQSSGNAADIGIGVGRGDQEYSVGLSQININGNPSYALSSLLSPVTNASAAFQLSKGGTDWSDWADAAGTVPANVTPQDQGAAASVVNNPTDAAQMAATVDVDSLGSIVYDLPQSPNIPAGVSLATLTGGAVTGGSVVGTGAAPGAQANVTAPTAVSSLEPTSASGSSNTDAGGVLGFLQKLNGYMNPSISSSGGALSFLDSVPLLGTVAKGVDATGSVLPALEAIGIRLLIAVPGLIGLVAAAALGLFGVAGADNVAKAAMLIPGGGEVAGAGEAAASVAA